jgi:hypothetical protein
MHALLLHLFHFISLEILLSHGGLRQHFAERVVRRRFLIDMIERGCRPAVSVIQLELSEDEFHGEVWQSRDVEIVNKNPELSQL